MDESRTAGSTGPARILIVEDEMIVAEDLALVLSSLGYKTAGIVASGEEVVEKIRELAPDLILMDIHLAGRMSGIEAADSIRTLYDAPVIYITAFADTHLIDRARATMPYGYIVKPYNEREIHSTIEIALYTHGLHQQVRASEERYRGFVENFLGIACRRRMDHSPEFFHGTTEAITGYTETELLSGTPSWEDLIVPEDRERIRQHDREIIGQGATRHTREYRIRRRDGTFVWVRELISVVPDSMGKPRYIQSAIYDITEQKDAEAALQKANEELEERVRERTESLNQQVLFLQQLINTIPSPVYYKDTRCTYTGCNTAFESYLGIPRSRILGKTDKEILPAEIAAMTREKDRFLLSHQGIQAYQMKFPHRDRTTHEVLAKKATFTDSEGKITGFIGFLVDITDRIQTEDRLRESEQRFRAVVQDQTDLICRILPNRTVLFANTAFLSYFGKRSEDTTGYIFRFPVHPDDQAAFDSHFASFSPDHPVGSLEFRCLKEGREERWHRWINRAFFDDQGNLQEYLSIGRDITEKKDLEIRDREAHLKMERIRSRLYRLNDQVRGPLSTLILLARKGTGENAAEILMKAEEIESVLEQFFLESDH